jgi:ribonuclease D
VVTEVITNGPEILTLLTEFFSLLDSSKLDPVDKYPSYLLDNRKVYVVQNNEELITAVESLKKATLLGFDSEQKPTFKRNQTPHGIATIQIASLNECYIFQVKKIDNLTPLIALLENENIAKVGINLAGDNHALYSEFGIRLKATIEIDAVLSKLTSKESIGAKKAAKIFLKKDLQKSKKMSTSNWENDILSDSQIKYAAEDAAVALDITIHLLNKYPFVIETMPLWFKERG